MKTIAKFLSHYPFFLVLLPTYVVIHLEKELHGLIPYKLVYDRILLLFAVPVLCFLIFYPFFRSVKKSSLMTLYFMVIFYYTGELKNWMSLKFPGSGMLHSYSFLLPAVAIVLLVLFFVLKKSKSELNRPYAYSNMLLLLLILLDGFLIVTPSASKYKIVSEAGIKNTGCDSCIKPDIYYILADAYSSSRNLSSEYGYSNQDIEEYLRSKGFMIVPHSHSNYNYTAYSMASIFNMNYIDNIDTLNITTNREYLQVIKQVQKNRVFPFLKKENYHIFNHSVFNIAEYPTTIREIDFWGFRMLFDQHNLAIKLFQDIGYHFLSNHEDPNFLNNFKKRQKFSQARDRDLAETIKLECNQPKFVYAHFLRPHPPYFFDSTGQFFSNANIAYPKAYIHQVASLNAILKKTVDSIIVYTQRPTVIIIQGDHGISFSDPPKQQDWFPNFNAIYFSNKDYRQLNDSTHNVNTFRILLNTFFQQELELLPYQSYFLKALSQKN